MTRSRIRIVLLAILCSLFGAAGAAEKNAPLPPPLPPPGDAIEPEITITSERDEIHEEYRYNGVLYRVKVIPAVGPPYYLEYDDRGRARRSDLEPDVIVPRWVIKRF